MKKIYTLTIKKGNDDIIQFHWEKLENIKEEIKTRYQLFFKYESKSHWNDFFGLLYIQNFTKSRYNISSYEWWNPSNLLVGRNRTIKEIVQIMLWEIKGDDLK